MRIPSHQGSGSLHLDLITARELQDEGNDRAIDAVRLQEADGMTSNIYPLIADAVINRDLVTVRRAWAELQKEMESDLKAVRESVDTKEETEWARESKAAVRNIVSLFEQEMLPTLSQEESEETIAKIRATTPKSRPLSTTPPRRSTTP